MHPTINAGAPVYRHSLAWNHTKNLLKCPDSPVFATPMKANGNMTINTICLSAGHYRVEEDSEHNLFYELEERI